MKEFKVHIKTIMTSRWFIPCLLLETFFLMLSPVNWVDENLSISAFEALFLIDRDNIMQQISYCRELVYLADPSLHAVVFMPVICVLPGIFAYCEERDSGYMLFSALRSSRRKREGTWVCAQMLSAAFILVAAYLLFAVVVTLRLPALSDYKGESAEYLARSMKEKNILLLRIGSLALYGMFIASASMLIGIFVRDRQMLLGTVFTSVYLYSTVIYKVMRFYIEHDDYEKYSKWADMLPEAFMIILTATPVKISLFAGIICLLPILFVLIAGREKRLK